MSRRALFLCYRWDSTGFKSYWGIPLCCCCCCFFALLTIFIRCVAPDLLICSTGLLIGTSLLLYEEETVRVSRSRSQPPDLTPSSLPTTSGSTLKTSLPLRSYSSLSPQAPLSPMVFRDQTTVLCGTPQVTRHSDLKALCLKWRSSPRISTTTSIPPGSRYECLCCGSGEIRRATVADAPSLKDLVLSHGDSGENSIPSFNTPCLFSDGCPFDSGKNHNLLNFPIKRLRLFLPRVVTLWAWPYLLNEAVKLPVSPPNVKPMYMVSDSLIGGAKMQRISGGFTGTFDAILMSYPLFLKNVSVLRAVYPATSFMRNVFPSNVKWRYVSLSITVLPSCGAACLGPEDATDVISMIFRGADWILTSQYKVTKSQVSGAAMILALTHSSFASSSLSFYLRGFSAFSLHVLLLFVVRVCLNSVVICNLEV